VPQPSLSVLIVNYNGAAHLPACLRALAEQTYPPDRFEVVVLDNASTDDSLSLVEHSWVRFVPLSKNVGFAEGNNVAARAAHGDCLALLNPDTIPDPFWLEELVRAADENPGAWVASKLVLADEPDRLNSAGLFVTRDGRGADRGFGRLDDGRYERGGEVFGGCAAALLVPRPALGEPLFDPAYFLYSEDLDACWRERKRGGRVILAPRAVVLHAVGASAGDRSPVFAFHVERNRALTMLKHADAFLAVWVALGLVARAGRAVARAATGELPWPVALAVLRAVGGYLLRAPGVLAERWCRSR
jgi:GT2 family glycosyltransferase